MKLFSLFAMLCLFLLPSCSMRQREIQLEKKINEVNQKEQQLLLKERSLQLKEQELISREQALDSSRKLISDRDTVFQYNAKLVGSWSVHMICTETTCTGSAVGDIKSEHWEIEYQNTSVIARAMSGKRLVRVYTGRYTGNTLVLTAEQQEDSTQAQNTRMVVRLQQTNDDLLEGRREIIRPDDCRIVYELELKRA